MSRYKLAVFDLDGTILNTLDDLYDSVSEALRKAGFPLQTEDEVRMALGRGFQHLIHECVPDGTDPDREAETLSNFEAVYAAHCADKTRPYDGILDAAAEIRKSGVHTAVLSNK
ncbi:MAG: HAD hydrolase-like protein, partial [Eubacteriales bacterium]|nr:HAD hydrolase-like protein [Eubacteriales bacterium]